MVRGSVASHQNSSILLTLKQAYLCKKITEWIFLNVNSLEKIGDMQKDIRR